MRRSINLTWDDSENNNYCPALNFLDDALIGIHLTAAKDFLMVRGIDFWQKDRAGVITHLAKGEDVMLFSGGDYFFENLGMRITAPKFWKKHGSIGLYFRKRFELQMDAAGPYEYSPNEITGKES